MRARGAGLQDFRKVEKAVQQHQVPSKSSVTFETLMGEQHFATGAEQQRLLFARLSRALSRDPFTGAYEHYLAVVLKSIYDGQGMFSTKRPPLNLIVVLDTSGSMGARFRESMDEKHGKSLSKIEVAKESLCALIRTLQPDDSIGIVTFSEVAQMIVPLSTVSSLDFETTKSKIQDIRAYGGTNLTDGMEMARSMLEKAMADTADGEPTDDGWVITVDQPQPTSKLFPESCVLNRVVFLTDMLPTQGKAAWHSLYTLTSDMAERQDFCSTFVGVGIDFNQELCERLGQLRGCNALSVFSADEFGHVLNNGLPYLVTPIAHDVSVRLTSDSYRVSRVMGCPGQRSSWQDQVKNHNLASGADTAVEAKADDDVLIFKLPTVFASPHRENSIEARGGIVLLQLERLEDSLPDNDAEAKGTGVGNGSIAQRSPVVHVELSFTDPSGARHNQKSEIAFSYEHVKEAQGMVSWDMLEDEPTDQPLVADVEYAMIDCADSLEAGAPKAPISSVYDDNCVRKALVLLRFSDYLCEWIDAVGRIFILTDFQLMKFTKLFEYINTEIAQMKEESNELDTELAITAATLQQLMITAFRGYS